MTTMELQQGQDVDYWLDRAAEVSPVVKDALARRFPTGGRLTVREVRARFLARQNGKCAICGADGPTHLDHDHQTGEYRGVLCLGCNVGLGHFRDDPKRLGEAIRYLDRVLL